MKINFFNNALHFRVGWRLYFSHLLTAARGFPPNQKNMSICLMSVGLSYTYLYCKIRAEDAPTRNKMTHN